LRKLSRGGSETEVGSPSEEQSSGDDFASHCVHKRVICSVDINSGLADNPWTRSSVTFYTQAEISQKQTALSLMPGCGVDKEQE